MESQPDEACTNESLASDDVAVGGEGYGRKNNTSAPKVVVAAPTEKEDHNNNSSSTAQRKNLRKRALSTAEGSNHDISLGALSASGISLLANMPPNSSGGEGSIVSFGLNFNFDSTSSPSNSDSGEGDNGKVGGSDGEKMKSNNNQKESEHGQGPSSRPEKKTSKGSGGSGSDDKKKENKQSSSSPPNSANTNSKENSESASSDSGQDQDYNDSGGSAASGSGNDGSSGGKSTISSLTTSSNQEWMAKQAKEAGAGNGGANKNDECGASTFVDFVSFNKLCSHSSYITHIMCTTFADANLPKTGAAATSGKKRKKASQSKAADANDEDSTGGYKTDEEQWGGKINNKGDGVDKSNIHKQPHLVTTTTGNSDPSSLTDSNIVHQSKRGGGPPFKQARFSMDQAPHPRAAPNTENGSAQMGLSSLSSDTPTPNGTALGGRAILPSLMSAAQVSSSNPSIPVQTTSTAPKPRAKRGSSGKHHSATLDPKKRQERNAREKERSCRIAKQIDELRSLLSRGGVIVAKGTKSSVLSEAANYINILQQQQVQWEMDRKNMLQQMQDVGVTPSAVPSQGQLPQMMTPMILPGQQQQMVPVAHTAPSMAQGINANSVDPNDYKFIFNNSTIGMVSF